MILNKSKILTLEDYTELFCYNDIKIEIEDVSNERYLAIFVNLPKQWFDFNKSKIGFPSDQLLEICPSEIKIMFELFGRGFVDRSDAFIFKPWVLNIENQFLFDLFESFHLYIIDKLFYQLIFAKVFTEKLFLDDFNQARILKDLDEKYWSMHGLRRSNIPRFLSTDRISISSIDKISNTTISDFYKENHTELLGNIEEKYIREPFNLWYELRLNRNLNISEIQTIGYVRLYNYNHINDGSLFVEYIIHKKLRNEGYATEALSKMLYFLNEYSFALFVNAEVSEENLASINVLMNLNFHPKTSSVYDKGNYFLILPKVSGSSTRTAIINEYIEKYNRYFRLAQ